ncbi:ATP-binding protein, partial [Aureimonas ureilytica]
GIGIALMPPADDADPAVDEILAGLAVRNLVENAINHSPDGGLVTVRWDASRLEVVDAGDGMKEEEIGRAAERFFRGANRTSVGSGLGLTIVELCARRMDAELVLANLAPRGFSAMLRFGGRNLEPERKP